MWRGRGSRNGKEEEEEEREGEVKNGEDEKGGKVRRECNAMGCTELVERIHKSLNY